MTVAGNLIEMNAKDVLCGTATVMAWVGFLAAVAFLLLAVVSAINDAKVLYWVFLCLVVVGVVVGIAGTRGERIKEIRYCANGPIQIEQVAAVYDIISIDGKEIVVRER